MRARSPTHAHTNLDTLEHFGALLGSHTISSGNKRHSGLNKTPRTQHVVQLALQPLSHKAAY